jgi:hypothetical protein
MERRRSKLLVLLAVSGCSADAPDVNRLAESIRLTNCGLFPAMHAYMTGRGSGEARPANGGPIKACELPTAENIANACASREGVPIPGSEDPDNLEAPRYSFPAYKVRAPACRFADAGETMADCAFELLAEGRAPARIRARLTFRFRDLSNNIAHNYYSAAWEAAGTCLPR